LFAGSAQKERPPRGDVSNGLPNQGSGGEGPGLAAIGDEAERGESGEHHYRGGNFRDRIDGHRIAERTGGGRRGAETFEGVVVPFRQGAANSGSPGDVADFREGGRLHRGQGRIVDELERGGAEVQVALGGRDPHAQVAGSSRGEVVDGVAARSADVGRVQSVEIGDRESRTREPGERRDGGDELEVHGGYPLLVVACGAGLRLPHLSQARRNATKSDRTSIKAMKYKDFYESPFAGKNAGCKVVGNANCIAQWKTRRIANPSTGPNR
jgi:hypothetical protein